MELLPNPESGPQAGPSLRPPINILDGLLRQGVRCQAQGRLPDAERIYRRILAIDPRHAPTLFRLGTLAYQVGNLNAAAQFIGSAVAIDPQVPAYHCKSAAILLAQGRSHEAATAYRQALSLDPECAEARVSLRELGAVSDPPPSTPGKVLDIA